MKKIVLVLLPVLLLFNSLVFLPRETKAIGPLLRVAGGTVAESVLVGIAEKAGQKMSESNKDLARQRWNMDAYEDSKRYENEMNEDERKRWDRFNDEINNAKVEPVKGKLNVGKVLLSGAAFLTGVDLIYRGYESFKTAYNESEKIEVADYEKPEGVNRFTGIPGFQITNEIQSGSSRIIDYVITYSDGSTKTGRKKSVGSVYNWGGWLSTVYDYDGGYISIYSNFVNRSDYYEDRIYAGSINTVGVPYRFPVSPPAQEPLEVPSPFAPYIPEGEEVPRVKEIPTINPDTVIEIEIPLSPDMPSEASNEPITQKEINKITDTPTVIEPNPVEIPESAPSPVEEPAPENIPEEPLNPNDPACKKGADDLLGIFKDFLVGNFACFDWKKLKMTGSYFTTKFPFSLPWDVGRGINAVFGGLTVSDELPEFDLKIGNPSSELYWEGKIVIPDRFLEWFSILRVMILVAFNFGLIYSVRKLLGGAQ